MDYLLNFWNNQIVPKNNKYSEVVNMDEIILQI